jgi:hypothetical protein
MDSRRRDKTHDEGFMIMTLLILSFILYSLLSLAMSANYRLHRQNRRMAEELHARAASVRIEQRQPSQ